MEVLIVTKEHIVSNSTFLENTLVSAAVTWNMNTTIKEIADYTRSQFYLWQSGHIRTLINMQVLGVYVVQHTLLCRFVS